MSSRPWQCPMTPGLRRAVRRLQRAEPDLLNRFEIPIKEAQGSSRKAEIYYDNAAGQRYAARQSQSD
eukprot:CAMPEP_0180058226 /NCGR_PEP_ID=MMETSP0985-20121206/4903_1 /TAXON_ID=483367 /ORGANISM="non described non described, Strain CCMP 2436" /LENGTH=66 /DNA_ID=CAMNT_0021988183 /DNA_START=97 /DNA_END=294 /DNA_ORIENTATION=+